MEQLLAAEYLKQYQPEFSESSKKAAVIVHRVPRSVWQDKRYQAWVKAFGPETHVRMPCRASLASTSAEMW